MSLTDTSQHANCSAMSDVLNRIGDKWSVMVVGMLGRNGTLRFNELKRMINGVSQRMLTLTLRNLERDGLVTRVIYPEDPAAADQRLVGLVSRKSYGDHRCPHHLRRPRKRHCRPGNPQDRIRPGLGHNHCTTLGPEPRTTARSYSNCLTGSPPRPLACAAPRYGPRPAG